MNRKSAVAIVLVLFSSCQTLRDTGIHPSREQPLGEFVRAPFNDMIRNVQTSESFLGSVYFAFDDVSLSEDARHELDLIAAAISGQPGLVVVEGHADNVHSELYSRGLGYERALAVAEYLRRAGVWDERLVLHSFGETRPAASNRSELGRAQNRRVVITLLTQGEGMSGEEAVQVQTRLMQPGGKGKEPAQMGFVIPVQSQGGEQ